MRIARFYHDGHIARAGPTALSDAAAHHARDVLRLREGDNVTLFNSRDGEFSARIVYIDKRGVGVEVNAGIESLPESPLDITLGQAISAGDKMDFTLQKAIELGVRAIQPLASERSVVKLSAERAEKRRLHWQAVAIAASEQSGRGHVAPVEPVRALRDWLAAKPFNATGIMLAPAAAKRLVALQRPAGPIWLLIGPEGGFSETEQAAATAAGFSPVALGPRILRTETAAMTALAAMQTLWGDF